MERIQDGAALDTELRYGPERRRYCQRTEAAERVTETAYYEAGRYEIVVEGNQVRRKAYVAGLLVQIDSSAGGSASAGTRRLYLPRDHLGSVESVTDAAGRLVARSAFAPFGARRGDDWEEATAAGAAALPDRTFSTTTRGFTDHEHLDASGLIHMGGRVYDPALGRFLGADPVVVAPDLSQGYNRYSYVLNDPLSRTDPTGMTPSGEVRQGDPFAGERRRRAAQDAIAGSSVVSVGPGGSSRANAADAEARVRSGFLNRRTGTRTGRSFSSPLSGNPISRAIRAGLADKTARAMNFVDRATLGASSTVLRGVANKLEQIHELERSLAPPGIECGVTTNCITLPPVFGPARLGSATRAGPKLLETPREVLLRRAQDPRLRDAVDNLYRPGARVGTGSSMDAFRFEQRTGELLSRTGHQQKLLDRRPQLHEVFRDPKVSQSDRTLARELLTDLQNALSGK